jgi:hypothetical protein
MEIIKVNSGTPQSTTGWTYKNFATNKFVFTIDFPDSFSGSTAYLVVTDMLDFSIVYEIGWTRASFNGIDVVVPLKYDADYKVQVYSGTSAIPSNLFFEDYYEVRRPYVDPTTKSTVASEVAKYKDQEALARAIIDSIVTDGFYYKRHLINTLGLGNDYLAVWDNLKRVIALYENNVLVYKDEDNIEITGFWDANPPSNSNLGLRTLSKLDYSVGDIVTIQGSTNLDGTYTIYELLENAGLYGLRLAGKTITSAQVSAEAKFGSVKKYWTSQYVFTPDQTALTLDYTGEINRRESTPSIFPAGSSDYIGLMYGGRGFAPGNDYTIVGEDGYLMVPSDIKRATEMIIDDIECGRLDYYKRYINAYNTDQFDVKFDTAVFEGTGNILVDKILSKYFKAITHPGVL